MRVPVFLRLISCLVFASSMLGCAVGGSPTEDGPQVAESGLVVTEVDMPGMLLVREDHGIGSYDAFLIPPAVLSYRRGSSELPDDLEEVFKVQLEQTLIDAADQAEIPIVREPGACVMVIALGLLDVDVERRSSADPVGEMTVAMEFRDSQSGQPLLHYEAAQSVANDRSGDDPPRQVIRGFDRMLREMQLAGALRAAGLTDGAVRPECDGLLAQRGLSLTTPAVSAR